MIKLTNQPIRAIWRWLRCLVSLRYTYGTLAGLEARREKITGLVEVYSTRPDPTLPKWIGVNEGVIGNFEG